MPGYNICLLFVHKHFYGKYSTYKRCCLIGLDYNQIIAHHAIPLLFSDWLNQEFRIVFAILILTWLELPHKCSPILIYNLWFSSIPGRKCCYQNAYRKQMQKVAPTQNSVQLIIHMNFLWKIF